MRAIARKAYDKIIREGLCVPSEVDDISLSRKELATNESTAIESSKDPNLASKKSVNKLLKGIEKKEKLNKCELPKHVKKKLPISTRSKTESDEVNWNLSVVEKQPADQSHLQSTTFGKSINLPLISSHSSRKIIPKKHFLEDYDSPIRYYDKTLRLDSNPISSKESSPEPVSSSIPDVNDTPIKKLGSLEQPLVVEGKRSWKPSLKVQMQLSEDSYDDLCHLNRKSVEKTSSTASSSGSGLVKDVIKKDMVSRYASIIAKKSSKDRLSEASVGSASPTSSSKEEDVKLEDKVAAKIEKLLKSQWESRLNKVNKNSPSLPLSSTRRNRDVQQTQRHTKNILRKARLQLNKRTLMKLRKSESFLNLSSDHEDKTTNQIQKASKKSLKLLSKSKFCGFIFSFKNIT